MTRGTTLLGRTERPTSPPTAQLQDNQRPPVTLGLRPKLLNRDVSISTIVPLGGSEGNFDQFLPGRGFSLCPTPPCQRRTPTVSPGLLSCVSAFMLVLLSFNYR
jgi:hypothetical protein